MKTRIRLEVTGFELIIHSIDRSGKYSKQHVEGLFPSLSDMRYYARNERKIQNDLGYDNQGILHEWHEQHRDSPGSKAFTWDDKKVILKKGMTSSGNLEGTEIHIRRPCRVRKKANRRQK